MSESTNYPPVIAYFVVRHEAKAIEFYQLAFGATELYRLVDRQSGKVGHAELMINGGLVMLSEEWPGFNKAPETLGGTTFSFCVMVPNADAAIAQAISAGATLKQPPTDTFYGFRSGCVRDPFGHEWLLQHEIEKLTPAEIQQRWNSMGESGQE